MALTHIEFTQPDFLLCEIGIKDDTPHDERIWVYSQKSSSLIEFINMDLVLAQDLKGYQKDFEFFGETWKAVFVQNNCEATDNDSATILDAAIQYLKEYLAWEDTQED